MLINKQKLTKLFGNLFFNFNTVALPQGVMWTNLLSPFLVIWLLFHKKVTYLLVSLLLLVFYVTIQAISFDQFNFIDSIFSTIYFYSSVATGIFFYCYLNDKKFNRLEFEKILLSIVYVNLLLTLIAIPLYFTALRDYMWATSTNINSLGEVRLKLLYYEPSHSSFVFIFLSLYLLLKLAFYPSRKYLILLIFTAGSVFLGKSIGTMGAMGIAMVLGSFIYAAPLLKKYYKQVTLVIAVLALITPLLAGSITSRLEKFINGKDNSGNVRLFYASTAAYNAIEKYNYFFGIGFGQDKKYITEFTSKFAGYAGNRLPNSFASTLITVGIFGTTLKYLFLLYYFFKTRVHHNLFRLITFFYLFIYTFTGGWMFNVYEFILYAFTFSQSAFSEFDKDRIFSKKESNHINEGHS